MGEYLNQIPEKIRDHIKGITRTSGLPDTDDSVEKIAEAWLEKEKKFVGEIEAQKMEEVEILRKDEPNGAVIMTYSGSLLSIGPIINDSRKVSYASIELRQDVPHMLSKDDAKMTEDLATDQRAMFDDGPVQKTSPIFKIAVSAIKLPPEEEAAKLDNVTLILTKEFVNVNKTFVSDEEK